MVDIASLEESGLVLSKEAFSFTYEVEAKGKEGMGVIGRCGCVGEVDSRTEWVWGSGVMGSVCETDDGSADDDTDNGSADDCANSECANGNANNDATNYVSHANPYNTSSNNDSNGTANCSTTHL